MRDMLGEAGVRAAYQPTSCLAPAVQEGWFREPGVSASQREQRMRIIPDFSSHLHIVYMVVYDVYVCDKKGPRI